MPSGQLPGVLPGALAEPRLRSGDITPCGHSDEMQGHMVGTTQKQVLLLEQLKSGTQPLAAR